MKTKKVILTFLRKGRVAKKGEFVSLCGDTFSEIANDNYTFPNPREIYSAEIIEEDWKPKEAEGFYYIDDRGDIEHTYYNSIIDSSLIDSGNYFKTKEEAFVFLPTYKERMKEVFK